MTHLTATPTDAAETSYIYTVSYLSMMPLTGITYFGDYSNEVGAFVIYDITGCDTMFQSQIGHHIKT